MTKRYTISDIANNGWRDILDSIRLYGKAIIIADYYNDNTKYFITEYKAWKSKPSSLVKIIKGLKSVKKELQEVHKVGKIGICGSYVRGENTKGSDLDVVVENLPNFGNWTLVEKLISEATGVRIIDLLKQSSIKPFTWDNIEKEIIYI